MSKVQCSHQQRDAGRMGSRSADDFSDVAERIFHNLNVVFDRDDSLDEFDIIPVESKSNRSPVIHTDHKLALESWCVPFLYTHSFKNFIFLLPKNRFSASSVRNSSSCSREISSKLATLSESERISRALQLSRTLVLLNPDLTLAWNYRRSVFNTSLDFKTLQAELRLVSLTSTRKPKCPEGFTYRKWLVKKGLETRLIPNKVELFDSEAIAAEVASEKYFSNYHAWSYRLWLLEFIIENDEFVDQEQARVIVDGEYEKSTKWIEKHVSDYSGFHYRQKILQHIGSLFTRHEILNKLQQELEENHKMISLYPGHESLWYHRRATLRQFVHAITHSNESVHNEEMKNDVIKTQQNEKQLVESMQSLSSFNEEEKDQTSNKYSKLNALYSERHGKWLRLTFKWIL